MKELYDEFSQRGKQLGVTELLPLSEDDSGTSFCFRDPGTNCWEISCQN
jgi:hypothetical protein